MSELNNIPKHWQVRKLGDVCEIKSGKNQSKVINPNGKYPIYGSSGIFGYADDYICDEGTTIIGRKGTINSPIYVTTKFWNVDTAFGLCSKNGLDSKFLYYFCLGFNFFKLDKSTTIPSLAKSDLLTIDIPIPSLPEQLTIVSKIEELLSDLENGKQQLLTAQQQLKVYRQSLLKAAFEGKLTEEWRINNSNGNGQNVLNQINTRRLKVLNELIACGNNESSRVLNKIKKHTFNEPQNQTIPKNWSWTSLLYACNLVVDCHNKTAPYQSQGIYLIRTSNIKNGRLLLNDKVCFRSNL